MDFLTILILFILAITIGVLLFLHIAYKGRPVPSVSNTYSYQDFATSSINQIDEPLMNSYKNMFFLDKTNEVILKDNS